MGFKILIVDDDDVFVFLHNLLVEESGIPGDAIGFENGKTALDYLLAEWDKSHTYLILLDINMPVMNGWQLLDSIQSSAYADNVLVAMVSSSVDYSDRVKASQYSQVIAFCEKPLDEFSLKKVMQSPRLSAIS